MSASRLSGVATRELAADDVFASPSSASAIWAGTMPGFCPSLPGVELSAVVDTNRARAEEIAAARGHARRCSTPASSSGRSMP